MKKIKKIIKKIIANKLTIKEHRHDSRCFCEVDGTRLFFRRRSVEYPSIDNVSDVSDYCYTLDNSNYQEAIDTLEVFASKNVFKCEHFGAKFEIFGTYPNVLNKYNELISDYIREAFDAEFFNTIPLNISCSGNYKDEDEKYYLFKVDQKKYIVSWEEELDFIKSLCTSPRTPFSVSRETLSNTKKNRFNPKKRRILFAPTIEYDKNIVRFISKLTGAEKVYSTCGNIYRINGDGKYLEIDTSYPSIPAWSEKAGTEITLSETKLKVHKYLKDIMIKKVYIFSLMGEVMYIYGTLAEVLAAYYTWAEEKAHKVFQAEWFSDMPFTVYAENIVYRNKHDIRLYKGGEKSHLVVQGDEDEFFKYRLKGMTEDFIKFDISLLATDEWKAYGPQEKIIYLANQ